MRFILKEPEKKVTSVYYLIRKQKGDKRILLKYYPGISIKPADWNKRKQEVKHTEGIPWYDYNTKIETVKRTVKDIFRDNDTELLSAEIIKSKLDAALGRDNKTDEVKNETFFEYFEILYKQRKTKFGNERVKNMKTTIGLLKEFNSRLDWNSFDYSFYEDFVAFMEGKGLAKNYIGRQITNIKTVLNLSFKEGKHKTEAYKQYKKLAEKVYNIYLSEEELLRLYNLKLTGRHKKARDLFLIGCYTGMRVSNYLNIDPDLNIDLERSRITVIVNKNGPRVIIPIHWMVREIIEEYKGLPKSISEQKLNEYIKEVCKLDEAKLKQKIVSVRTEGGIRKEKVKEKWEMVTSHTARRSMATNLYLQNVRLKYIMSITGHKTESQCLEYIKTGLEEFVEEVAELDFWKKPQPVE